MLFNSYEFIFLFLPIVAFVFSLAARSNLLQGATLWLIVASLFFYGWWNPKYLALLAGSVTFNFLVGRCLRARPTKILLGLGIGLNLVLLAYFKYGHFLVQNLNTLTQSQIYVGTIVLPLAISFFTLQQIAFLIEAYRGDIAEHSFLHYSLFVIFFPQLIAGPIVYFKELFPQLTNATTFRFHLANLAPGLTIFAIGLFKKVVLADSLSIYATPVFAHVDSGGTVTFIEAWAGATTYSFQIYFDFSGYTDMAIGIAKIFGLRLPENFNSPYKAPNVIEFWRRWHMTLSRFFRDYLYIPLGGNRQGALRKYANLLLTMVVVGLWHGAAWTFVAWGALHGVYLLINHSWNKAKNAMGVPTPRSSSWSTLLSTALTFVAVTAAWVFFRSETFSGAVALLKGMTGVEGVALPRSYLTYLNAVGGLGNIFTQMGVRFEDLNVFYGGEQFAWTLFAIGIVWIMPNTRQIVSDHFNWSEAQNHLFNLRFSPSLGWGVYVGCLLLLSMAAMTRISEFIYFQF